MSTATLTRPALDNDLTPEMVRLLKYGAAHPYGHMVQLRSDSERFGRELQELRRRGYQREVGWDPMITEAGRAAVGAPTEREADNIRLQAAGVEHAAMRTRREAKAEPRDPRADNYLTWKSERKFCVLVVRHRPRPKSFAVTRDGSGHPNIFLPFSRTDELTESDADFLLAVFALPFVEWMETKDGGKDYVAAQRYRELFGVTLPLSAARPWTAEQIATWERLDKLRSSINWRIQAARTTPRKVYSRMPFGYTA